MNYESSSDRASKSTNGSTTGRYRFSDSGGSNQTDKPKDSGSSSSRSGKSGTRKGNSGRGRNIKSRQFGFFSGRNRRLIGSFFVLGFLLLGASLRGLATFYTDYLWFSSLDRTDVWQTVLLTKILLFLIFFSAFFVLIWLNLMIADRIAPKTLTGGLTEEVSARFRVLVSGRRQLLRLVISTVCSLLAISGVIIQWEKWLLFLNSKHFGVADPLFKADISFYVFRLPFWSFIVDWTFASFILIFIAVTFMHFLNGGISLQSAGIEGGIRSFKDSKVLPAVKMHMSAILAVLALLKAADYWLARFELTISDRGVVDGALYTDVTAKLPALNFLLVISLIAAVVLLVNVFLRGWMIPVLAVGLWAFIAVVIGNIYPSIIQRFQVDPNTTDRESSYVERNIEATRAAYALTPDEYVTRETFDYDKQLTPQQIQNARNTVLNTRILDPLTLTDTFDKEQGERDFYRFSEVLDIDRYEVNGELTPVVLAARELNLSELGSWERQHVAITHGYGLATALANTTTVRGSPVFIVGGLPVQVDPALALDLAEPQIYVGENLAGYALVNASRDEVDYVGDVDGKQEEVPFRYTGDGGVGIGSIARKAAFALRFSQLDPLITNFITKDSKIIYIRDVRSRLKQIAPFLEFDSDIYPVVHEGRIHYVVDAYTTTNHYPYSQQADTSGLSFGADLTRVGSNYIRNSAKAVVDSYTGDVTLYVMPVDDPIIEAWRSAFPKLFADFAEMPENLREHLRFPTDLFTIQTNMWSSYQISEPKALIIGTERWAVAQDPGRLSVLAGGTAEAVLNDANSLITFRERRMTPYYSLIELPGEEQVSFVVMRSFVPISEADNRKELTAFMVGETRADGTSRLVSYDMSNQQAPGPAIVASNIHTNPDIRRELTLLNNDQGSTVEFGDLLLLPIENSLLYIRPLYVKAQGTQIPLLAKVIASVGDRTAMGDTLEEALNQLYPGADFTGVTTPPIVTEGDDTVVVASSWDELIAQLQDLYSRESAKQTELEALIEQLINLLED